MGNGVDGGCLRGIFSEPGNSFPLPVSSPLPPKFGARAGEGKGRTAGQPASSRPWRRFRDASAQLTPASKPPPAGEDPTLRGWGPAPAASAHNFSLLSVEPAPSRPRLCALPRGGGGENGREARPAGAGSHAGREAAPGGRRPVQRASKRSVLPGALPARARAGEQLAAAVDS